jgi:hypothetical protein
MNTLIDAVAHYEFVKVIRCDIKPGSAERSRDLDEEGTHTAAGN